MHYDNQMLQQDKVYICVWVFSVSLFCSLTHTNTHIHKHMHKERKTQAGCWWPIPVVLATVRLRSGGSQFLAIPGK
jgi:hypothetical protein